MASGYKDLRIVLVGKTGVGKSATGNTILREKKFHVKQALRSVTKKCETFQQRVEGRNISVVDTPGLSDTSMSEEELKEEIVKCVEMSVPGPHVFLLILRPDVRLTNDEKNAVKWIQENFGEEASQFTIILFTRRDQLEIPIEKFLTEGDEGFKQLVEQCKGGYHVFNNKDEEDQSQVTELLKKIDRLVNENGGSYYTNEMYKEAQKKIQAEERKRLLKKAAKAAIAAAGTAVGMGDESCQI